MSTARRSNGLARMAKEPLDDLVFPGRDYESRARFFEELFDSAPEPTVILQGERIVQANREFVRVFGYSLEECIGADIHDLILPNDRREERETMQDAAAPGQVSVETVRRTRDGNDLDVCVVTMPVRLGPHGVGSLVAYRDVRTRRQSEARPHRSALHDGLTGLANRALFLDRLTVTLARQQRRPERRFAAVLLIVDGLRQVNERHGHAAGDAVLVAVAARLEGCLRPHDTIARFRGGEFGLLLDEAGSPDDVAGVVERVLRAVERPVEVGGVEVEVRASLGVALSVDGWTSAEAMMRQAEQAMNAEKCDGDVGHALYTQYAGAVYQTV